jgi:hypothetical protein
MKFRMFDLVKCAYGYGNIVYVKYDAYKNSNMYKLHGESQVLPKVWFREDELTLVTDRVAVITDYEHEPIFGGKFIVIEGPGIHSMHNISEYTPETAAASLIRYNSRSTGIYKVVDAKTLKQIFPII